MTDRKPSETKISTIGIVGGGQAGLQFLQMFSNSALTRVIYVVDRDPKAAAVTAALTQKIEAYDDLAKAITLRPVDFICEVTGSAKVAEAIRELIKDTPTQLLTHDMAFILLKVLEDEHRRSVGMVLTDIMDIKTEIGSSLGSMSTTLSTIKQTTSDLRYLSINARIEAARAGEHGRGFAVVAQQVDDSAREVREMALQMEQINTNVTGVLSRIEQSVKKLQS